VLRLFRESSPSKRASRSNPSWRCFLKSLIT
jgi:hypothetical protein